MPGFEVIVWFKKEAEIFIIVIYSTSVFLVNSKKQKTQQLSLMVS